MEANNADINSVCFGILCNFTPVCGEERAKEAVATVRSLQAENKKLYELIGEAQKLLHAYQDVIVPDYKKCIEQLEKERDDAVATLKKIREAREKTRPAYVVDEILQRFDTAKPKTPLKIPFKEEP